jgi:hypothetical protein
MKDKIIICQDCQQEFVWTGGEQEFYKEKNLSQPLRCLVCRAIYKKAQQDQFRGKINHNV